MAIDAGDYKNGNAAMTMLRGKFDPRGGNQPGFMGKVGRMSFAFTERFEAHIRFPGTLNNAEGNNLKGIGDGAAQHLRTNKDAEMEAALLCDCLLYTSPSPRD